MMVPSLAAAAIAAAVVLAPLAAAAAPPVDEIINRTNLVSYFQAGDGRARVAMTITDRQGRTRNREFTILRRDAARTDAIAGNAYKGEQKYYVYFHRPSDVSKMAFLVWKLDARDDDRWLYLPALDLVKRIAASDKRTSFAGSDFFYEDVSGRSIDLDRHELVEESATYYKIRNTPKDPNSVEFSHYDMYIHKETFLPIQTEYFDRRGTKYRVYRVLKVEKLQGFHTVTQAVMEDLGNGSKTVLDYSKVEYEVGIADDVFSERYLRMAPMQYLR